MKLDRYLRVKAHAQAREEKLIARGQDRFEIWVREPAELGRANKAVLALLSAHLRLPLGRLWMIKGAHSPAKIIAVRP